MERYVASKEWAEKLRKAGWRKPTNFYRDEQGHRLYIGEIVFENDGSSYECRSNKKCFPAPLLSEMLEIVDDSQVHYYLMEKYGIATAQSLLDLIRNKDEVAAMLCYLSEQGIVKLTALNK